MLTPPRIPPVNASSIDVYRCPPSGYQKVHSSSWIARLLNRSVLLLPTTPPWIPTVCVSSYVLMCIQPTADTPGVLYCFRTMPIGYQHLLY
jgi:hypothetical protein